MPDVARRAVDRLGDEGACRAVLGAAMLAYAVLAMWVTRGTTLFVDEASFFVVDRGLQPDALLAPLNGNLEFVSRLIYAVGFKLFGVDFVVFRLVEVVGAALAVGLFFVLVKRRIGAAAALAPSLLLLFLGSAWEVTFVVSGISNTYSVAAGLGALLAVERRELRGDVIACALLIVAVSAYTLGVAFAIGAVVLVALRAERPRRVWLFLLPLALYGAWLLWVRAVYVPEHGEVQDVLLWNILLIPNFIANEAAAVAGAVAGLNYDFRPPDLLFPVFGTDSPYGPLIAAAAAVALVVSIRRRGMTPFLWASLAALLAFWTALALGYGVGRSTVTVRYVYGGAVLAALVAAEAARGARPSRAALLVLFAAAAIGLSTNMARLRDGITYYRDYSITLRAQLTSLELARGRVSDPFVLPTGPAKYDVVEAGPYLAAVDRIGSPAFSLAELARQSEAKRHEVDSGLVSALGIETSAATPDERALNCRQITAPRGSPAQVLGEPPGVLLRSPVRARVELRRFATASTVPAGRLEPGRLFALRLSPDQSSSPWHVSVTPAVRPVTACELRISPSG